MTRHGPFLHLLACGLLFGLAAAGCGSTAPRQDAASSLGDPALTTVAISSESPAPPPRTAPSMMVEPVSPGKKSMRYDRPSWLGTRVLPRRSDGFGEAGPTPPELRDRRLQSLDVLQAPNGDEFISEVRTVPEEVRGRSTWSPLCPVALEDLRYVTLTFWGFDERPHTGELLVHASVAEDVVDVFRRLYEVRFPIEEIRVVTPAEFRAPPTGDGNNTASFVCRPTTGGSSWSEHAYGLAVDLNPFHNPYAKGDLVVPELATAYTNRNWRRPGMIFAGDAATESFARIGWGWGGAWRGIKDWMHFSRKGR